MFEQTLEGAGELFHILVVTVLLGEGSIGYSLVCKGEKLFETPIVSKTSNKLLLHSYASTLSSTETPNEQLGV